MFERILSRQKASVVRQFHDYREAFHGFSYNAKSFLVSGFLQALGGGMLGAIFAIYMRTAGINTGVIGETEAALSLGAAVVALLGMPLISALGYRVVIVAALGVLVVSRFTMVFVPTALMLVALSLAVGLGDGFMRSVGSAFMAHNSDEEERSHLFSVEFITRMVAGFAGSLAGGMLPGLLQGWGMNTLSSLRGTMVAGVAIVAVGLIPMLFLREREGAERRPVREAYGKSFVGFKSWRHVGKLIAPQAIISLGGGLVMPFIPLYLKGSLHASLGQIGLILGLSSIVTAFGAFGTPVIARKFGLGTGVSMLQGLAVPFLAIVSLAHSLPLAVGALWVRGTLMNMAGPLFNQLSMEGLDEHEKPTVGGWLFCALNLTWLVGSLVGGKLMETSYVAPYIGAVVLYATGAGLTYLLWGGKGKAAEEPEGSLEALPEAA